MHDSQKGGFTVSQVTLETPLCPLLSFTMLGHGGTGVQTILLQRFAEMGQRTSLNLSPLFDHAVIVQKFPGRFLCVGRDRSHQEADQVISIISLIPHSGTDFFCGQKNTPKCCFSRALSFENQQNEINSALTANSQPRNNETW